MSAPVKKVVHFRGEPDFYQVKLQHPVEIEEFKQYLDEHNRCTLAWVWSIDHPYIPEGKTRTSIVLNKNDDGSFETLNTLYVPINSNE